MTGPARLRAFTLVEVLAALAIVAVLASLAVASHERFLLAARRLDARAALVALAAAQERHRLAHGRYADRLAPANPARAAAGVPRTGDGGATPAALAYDATSPEGWYELRIAAVDDDGYRLEARARGAQRRDRDCASLTLDGTGGRAGFDAEGRENTARCWN